MKFSTNKKESGRFAHPLARQVGGFTIIEIMMAIFVMGVGIVGIYALIPQIILTTIINTNRLVASQLAGEAFEVVRNIRDSNWIKETSWDTGLNFCSGGCEIDYNDEALSSFQDRFLKVDANGFFNYEAGQNTKFKRRITIIEQGAILDVEVEVSWLGKYSPITIKDRLYNWR